MTTHPTWWDPHSSQPYKLAKNEKPRFSLQNLFEYCKIISTACALSPAVVWKYNTLKPGEPKSMCDMAGLSINPDQQWQSAHLEMIEEIGVRNLLVRIPSWESHRLDEYLLFLDKLSGHDILINILQSRHSIADPSQWKSQLREILKHTSPLCNTYMIGNAVNRSKWGCRHSGDALRLFLAASELKQEFTEVNILTSSVIDFEPLISLRTLYNFSGYQSDGCASLLYINRRGSCDAKQFGFFNLQRKIRLNKAILKLSNNTKNKLWITETNWPLLDTKPYTPNSGHPRSTVDEQTQARYLSDYFRIASQTGWVERVYWWQLINPGYGLVDHRDGRLRKMPSYYAFKSLFDSEDGAGD